MMKIKCSFFFFSYLYHALLTWCVHNSCLFCHLSSSTWCLCCSHVGTMPFENPIKLIFVLMLGVVLDDDIFSVCVKGCGDTNSTLTQLNILLSKYVYGTSAKYLCKIQKYKDTGWPEQLLNVSHSRGLHFFQLKQWFLLKLAMQSLGRTQL